MKEKSIKIIIIVTVLAVLAVLVVPVFPVLVGNKEIIDMTYDYSRAIISLPNGETIEGEVQSWRDYEDGDQIQVKISNKTYLVHSSNIVLIAD